MAVLTICELDEIGLTLREIRKKGKGVNQQAVMDKVGCSSTTISDMENGGSTTTKFLKAYAEALGIKVAFVIALDENDLKRLMDANG